LLYFLFRLLRGREPVALQINAQQFVIFDQHGVRVCFIHAEKTFSIPKGIWTLSDSSGKQQLEPCTRSKVQQHICYTAFLVMTLALALCRSADAQQHAVFDSHPSLRSPTGWIFENMAHVVVANLNRPRLEIYNKAQKEYFMPAPEEMISGNSALRSIKRGFRPFNWRPRESNYEGVDSVLRSGYDVWALQYTVSRSHRALPKVSTRFTRI